MPPTVCPNCGADVPPGAKACPECGSDEKTGWSDEAHTGGLDLPDEEFNYDEYVKNEFGGSPKPHGTRWIWWVVAVLLVIGFVFMLVRR